MSDLFRKYEPIWIQLKARGTVSLIASRPTHSRIVKAVVQEKWKDTGYKLTIDPKIGYLSHKSEGSKLTFTLEMVEREIPDRRTKRLGVKHLVRNL